MERIIKVGKMPGRINEVVVGEGTTVRDLLALAELDHVGYDIKIDGEVGTLDTVVGNDTNLVLLGRQVKGNGNGMVKVGKMPGKSIEVVVGEGTTVRELLELAEFDHAGHEIKVDGEQGTLDTVISSSTNLVLLAKLVKGNK